VHFGRALAEITERNSASLKRKAYKMGSLRHKSDIEMSLLTSLTQGIFRRKMLVSQELLGEGKEKPFSARPYFFPAA